MEIDGAISSPASHTPSAMWHGRRGMKTVPRFGCSTVTASWPSAGRRRDCTSGRMNVDKPAKRLTTTFEQLSYSNMLQLEALVELLDEKGLLSKQEIVERVKKLQHETKVNT